MMWKYSPHGSERIKYVGNANFLVLVAKVRTTTR